MTKTEGRKLLRKAEKGKEQEVRKLYAEVYGAEPSEALPTERVRSSIAEAILELMGDS